MLAEYQYFELLVVAAVMALDVVAILMCLRNNP